MSQRNDALHVAYLCVKGLSDVLEPASIADFALLGSLIP